MDPLTKKEWDRLFEYIQRIVELEDVEPGDMARKVLQEAGARDPQAEVRLQQFSSWFRPEK
jgi:hypothetical protein